MPANVLKIGETHSQSPLKRAAQFTGVDGLVTWEVVYAVATPDSKTTEKLVHRQLKAMHRAYQDKGELFAITPAEALEIIERCAARTPVPAPILRRPASVAVPKARGPWAKALAMPLSSTLNPGITLARAMALVAEGDSAMFRRLSKAGVELVYPDAKAPYFRIHAQVTGAVAKWLDTQRLTWSDLGIPTPGGHRDICCQIRTVH